ncbi:MAG TPA: T9SS type A sorting domain-containing protein, partial [Saprospiraceae bacterium]|nr:T9SS type A sorting domain-containing protein [Saprospiraceae bacterium]
DSANVDSTAIVLTCADTGNLVVEIWAWDAAGNSDFCETYIEVQDNFGVCGSDTLLLAAGSIATEANSMVEDVEVTLSGEGFDVMMTGANGWYGFSGLQEGYDYTVTPMRNGDYLNGVSTYDLVVISKHILGVAPLNSPYKIIAADVNNSHTVTTLDMILLRKLILSVDTEFGNNNSWRFVARSYVFPEPANPWLEDFPEVISINNLPTAGLNDADFIAVKVGDVTLDAITNSLQAVEERNRVATLAFNVQNEEVKAGNEYTVVFTAPDIDITSGYQATLTFDNEALELVDIIEGVAKVDNFGLRYLEEGLITTSWNGIPPAHSRSGKTSHFPLPNSEMFSLVFRAREDARLSELLGISSRITKAEAYNTDGEYMDVAIEFSESTVAADKFELYQNRPNPFREETIISFNLTQADQVTVTIADVSGRTLKLVRLDGVKGYNELKLKRGTLPTGVLSYSVKSGQDTATKKMILTE